MTVYAEIVAECALHSPARVREWVEPDGVSHAADEPVHPIEMVNRWAAQGWELVMVSVYENLRIYTLRRGSER